MPDLDQFLSALVLLALVLYLAPVVFRLDLFAERRRWFQRAASLTVGIVLAIAVVATLKWFMR
jgi:succinate dehydrogenase hydrophobic anchor subunit